MILAAISLMCLFCGILLTVLASVLNNIELLAAIPWEFAPIPLFVAPIIIIMYRGFTTSWWCMIDFPSANEKRGILQDGNNLRAVKLYRSIETYLKTKEDEYYKDTKDGAYTSGGHDTRLIVGEVAHTPNPEKALLCEKFERDGYYTYDEVKAAIIKQMAFLKDKDGTYYLTGSRNLPNPLEIDIVKNKAHKALFDALAEAYFITTSGRAYSLKSYHRFQEKTASPYQIGSIVHYVKSSAAIRAAKIRKKMPGALKYVVIIVIIIILILLGMMILLGGGADMLPI